MLESYIKLIYMDFGSLTDAGIIISPARAAHMYIDSVPDYLWYMLQYEKKFCDYIP